MEISIWRKKILPQNCSVIVVVKEENTFIITKKRKGKEKYIESKIWFQKKKTIYNPKYSKEYDKHKKYNTMIKWRRRRNRKHCNIKLIDLSGN